MRISLPYGKGSKDLEISEERIEGLLYSRTHEYKSQKSESEIVRDALRNPIGSESLEILSKGKKKIVIISSDHTRPVPSHVIMPEVLATIRKANSDAEITILVATGAHRASTDEELRDKYGDEIVDNVRIVMHDSKNEADMADLGTLPSGGSLMINRTAVEADLLIAEGFIEPHFFAGFSGGRKSILPGIASYKTVLANHCAEFIDSRYARTGILENNPLHIDMLYAAEKSNLKFIINVVIDQDKKVIAAFAGDREKAHYEGCRFLKGLAGAEGKKADVVVTTNGGYPLDQNIYQSVKGMTAAEASINDGGIIIMASECSDGHGGEEFYKTFKDGASPEKIMKDILERERNETVPDQWESQVLARLLMKHEIVMVTDAPKQMIEDMHMHYAKSMEEAFSIAEELLGRDDYRVTVIPDGVSVIVE
ncbi:Nickel-dependent lactate racemase [Dethiosulfatibacter aminovorans DSM 17477]|uniref:Nickel-dependent lactate racemase n=1 Tax=Dethiosulfatibacter aminovorans DSM 17477 TaxID=1121476 RepID=A0A1M6IQD9_9FIRM|nr:Nickel-dependent lactate racemase [Dethiosulfatibacter aminovorans DSM 17477]